MMKKLTKPYVGDLSHYTDMLHSSESFETHSHIDVEIKRDPKLKARPRPKSFHNDVRRRKSTKVLPKSLSAIGMKYQISEVDLVLYNEQLGGGNFGHMYLMFLLL